MHIGQSRSSANGLSGKQSHSNPPAAQPGHVQKLASSSTGAAMAIQQSNNFYSQRQGNLAQQRNSKLLNAMAGGSNYGGGKSVQRPSAGGSMLDLRSSFQNTQT